MSEEVLELVFHGGLNGTMDIVTDKRVFRNCKVTQVVMHSKKKGVIKFEKIEKIEEEDE